MFLVQEIDKLLESIGTSTRSKKRFRVNLPDIGRIDVEELKLLDKVQYPLDLNSSLRNDKNLAVKSYPTSNALFFDLAKQLVLLKIAQVPPHQYASAKLVICDRSSYNLIMKLQSMTYQKVKNFIFKPPFDVTAIFLLSDVVSLFDRERDSLIIMKHDKQSGKKISCFNYEFIRRIFPFIRISDLVVILDELGDLNLRGFDLKSSRESQIIQVLTHFARSSTLIELNSLYKSIGHPHPIYDNVLLLPPPPGVGQQHYFLKLPLPHLSFVTQTLLRLVNYLSLSLKSISYRAADPTSQTKFLAQLISTSVSSTYDKKFFDKSFAKVLIVDRFHDIQSVMFHADTYRAFLEQELEVYSMDKEMSKLRIDLLDQLDEELQFKRLTDVLSSILRYGITTEAKSPTTGRSIRRHLGLVEFIYKSLKDGYLLILKLEDNLKQIGDKLRAIQKPLTSEQELQVVEGLERVFSAFKQLEPAVRSTDLLRLACILLDTANIFLYSHRNNKSILDVKSYILKNSESKRKLELFDRLSVENCNCKSAIPLEKILQSSVLEQLSNDSFPIIDPSKKINGVTSLTILVFLGHLTPYELSKIKSLDFPILVIASDTLKPNDFLIMSN